MHEINIAERVFREARKAGAMRFLKVEVGELCEITVEELEEGLRKVTSPTVVESLKDYGGTVLQNFSGELDIEGGWDFKVDFVESKIKCKCGYEGRAKILDRGHGYCLFSCARCGETSGIEVLEGGVIKVVGVE